MVTACAPYLDDPAGILRTVNTELVHQHGVSAQFITMLCVVIKPDGTVLWASAGHPPPVSLADGQPIGEVRTGHPLGIAPEIADLEISRSSLPAEGILLYTDGLTDARPPGRSFQPFGEARIGLFLSELDRPVTGAGGGPPRPRGAARSRADRSRTTSACSPCDLASRTAGTARRASRPPPRPPASGRTGEALPLRLLRQRRLRGDSLWGATAAAAPPVPGGANRDAQRST